MRKNASEKTLLEYFVKKCEEKGNKYYVVIPWDLRNLKEQRDFYPSDLLGDLMDMYFSKKRGGWTVKDFIIQIPSLAEERDRNAKNAASIAKLKAETKQRMKEAGYI